MLRTFWFVGCSLAALVLVGNSIASPLNLTQAPPDISAGFVSINYNAATGQFVASGFAAALDLDGVAPPEHLISGGTFSLNVFLNTLTGEPISGTLTIGGTIAGLGAGSPLLTGNVVDFGFIDPPGGHVFEFLFTPTGGSLSSMFAPQIGVIVTGSGPNGFTLNSNYSATNGAADAFRLPEPGSAVIWAAPLVASAIWLCRRKIKLLIARA
jgi:hypothetical protein